jgi:hypothetical protein
VLGIIGVLMRPKVTERAGQMLLKSEGLTGSAAQGDQVTVGGDVTA